MHLNIQDKVLLPLKLKVKESMGIQEYIAFKKMKPDEIENWLKSCYNIRRDIVLRELLNFPNLVDLE
ncbi:hypothetical protein [Nostoc sp.]|uniref:hypothetical protein n=1 Tax=Nostoc sp. TaxID=1180 RepID=UPI002FFA8247